MKTIETRNEYDAQAEMFLTSFGLSFSAKEGNKDCPWAGPMGSGQHYTVTIRRNPGRRSIRFDFWGSIADAENGADLRAYSVLSCIGSDASLPDDPDELIAELGPMPVKQAIASAKFTKRLRAFFTTEELEALQEIR